MKPLNVAELERVLDERKTQLQQLAKKRDEVQKQLDEIDGQIQEIIGDGRSIGQYTRRRKRVKNERSLRAVVLDVLKANKAGFKLADLADKISETGYKSNSRNFRNVLYQCLYNTAEIVHDPKSGCYRFSKSA